MSPFSLTELLLRDAPHGNVMYMLSIVIPRSHSQSLSLSLRLEWYNVP